MGITENTDPAVLHAYDAADLSRELYNSSQAPNARDQFGSGNKFITPTIANGKVYVGTTNGVGVFGLLQSVPELSPSGLAFDPEVVSATSAAQQVTLTNGGGSALTISSVMTSGDFTQTNTCGTSISAAASCTISITFAPTQGGSRTGTLTVSDSALGSPHTVALSGTGQDFSIGVAAGSSALATVTAGQSASYKLGITPVGGFNQAVTLTCSGAPSEATCSLSVGSVTLNGSTASSVSVMVTTTAPGTVTGTKPVLPLSGKTYCVSGLLALASLLAMLARFALGRRRRVFLGAAAFSFGLSVVFVLFVAACGGGNVRGGPSNPATAAGTYTLTVNGNVSLGSSSLTRNLSLTLQVN